MIHPKTKIENPPFLGRFDGPISSSGRFVLPEEWRFITASNSDIYLMPDEDDGCLRLIPVLMRKSSRASALVSRSFAPQALRHQASELNPVQPTKTRSDGGGAANVTRRFAVG